MGRPKLLLPLGRGTVISRMLALLERPEIAATLVVVRPDDEPLRSAAADCGATVLQPDRPPPEMRDSVEYALQWIESNLRPEPADGWILIPADHPLLDSAVLDRLIAAWQAEGDKILVPIYSGRRGHPTIFPCPMIHDVYQLPADQGLNSLLQKHAGRICEVEVNSPGILTDLDTPEDYARLQP